LTSLYCESRPYITEPVVRPRFSIKTSSILNVVPEVIVELDCIYVSDLMDDS